jgi:hypothetical protein
LIACFEERDEKDVRIRIIRSAIICSLNIRVIKLKIIGLTENMLKGRDNYGNVDREGNI